MELLHRFFSKENIPLNAWPTWTYVDKIDLPKMEGFLLTQPLLTSGIAAYYQRTPKIRAPLHSDEDLKNKQCYRAVMMIIDNSLARNDALLADRLKESTVVELGLIAINYAALPQAVINAVRNSQTPFGALLVEHKINTHSINTQYFKMTCTDHLTAYLQCEPGKLLYARSNTLVRDDTQVWVAQVVEILTGKSL